MKEIKNSRLLIDSDIIIDHLRGTGNLEELIKDSAENSCFISVISIAEIYSLLYANEFEIVNALISQLKIFNVDLVI
ncbi:MAG: type II toxin-antitoxin system VapC family toxin, partial [Actinobacteria bacterium]|nr:type II toxin-antitoxin system VapC family toxin [Actinomycetota bacterium]